MAKLAGIVTADQKSKFDSGAAFFLANPHKFDLVIPVDSHWEIEVSSSSPYVVARGRGVTELTAFDLGYEKIQIGLDLLSIKYGIDLSTCNNKIDQHLIWWREGSTQVLRLVVINDLEIKGFGTGNIRDQFGNLISQVPVHQLRYHKSLRYLRLAQATEDLFDSYRNMYLSLELLVSSISSKSKNESEEYWLKRVLRNYQFQDSQVEKIYNVRCRLFHAKDGKPALLPHNLQDRVEVEKVLKELKRIVLFLTENRLNIRPLSREENRIHLSESMFNELVDNMLSKLEILVSDNDALLPVSEKISYDSTVKLATKYLRTFLKKVGQKAVLGQISSSDLNNIKKITGFVLKRGNALFGLVGLEAELTCESIDRLEVAIRYKNLS
ncbi:MAG: hypothetical protein WBV73_24560 [Phormidium sp.]